MLRLAAGISTICLLALSQACSTAATPPAEAGPVGGTRSLLMVVDGLRPDYITPETMPNLYALGTRGVFGDAHTAAFPSLTRVNAASISTGSYPTRHGITHNTMWTPELGVFSSGDAAALQRLADGSGGRLLTAPSAGEILQQHGRLLLVAGSGGSGNSLLQNPRASGKGIWTSGGFFQPEAARQEAERTIGVFPGGSRSEATAWAVDAYLHHALGDAPPHMTMMWINETDAAGHAHGVGSPEVLQALASVDRQIGRIVQAHADHGLTDRVNIFVTADHGFTTNTGSFDLSRVVEEAGLSGDDAVVVQNMIYLRDPSSERLAAIVQALQRHPEIGTIYTRPAPGGGSGGVVPGTVSRAVVRWDHPRSAEILITPTWHDAESPFGFPGSTSRSGVATHGSDSPYDMHIRLVAAGPDLKRGVRSGVPTGNVDLVPTILHLQGITPLAGMDGRVLHELLRGGPEPHSVEVHDEVHRAEATLPDGFRYETAVETARVGSTVYLRGARTRRGG
jgi:arylsulfatase A-like enzyme